MRKNKFILVFPNKSTFNLIENSQEMLIFALRERYYKGKHGTRNLTKPSPAEHPAPPQHNEHGRGSARTAKGHLQLLRQESHRRDGPPLGFRPVERRDKRSRAERTLTHPLSPCAIEESSSTRTACWPAFRKKRKLPRLDRLSGRAIHSMRFQ